MKDKKETINTVSGYSPEFGERLQTIVSIIGTQGDSAKIAEVTTLQLRKWRDGTAKMPLIAAGKLCGAAGVTLDWLYSGKVPDPEAALVELDDELLADVVSEISKSLKIDKILKDAEFPYGIDTISAAIIAAYRGAMISRARRLDDNSTVA